MIIVQFVIGILVLCALLGVVLGFTQVMIFIGGWIDHNCIDDSDRLLIGIFSTVVIVAFVVFALILGDVVMPFLGIKG